MLKYMCGDVLKEIILGEIVLNSLELKDSK